MSDFLMVVPEGWTDVTVKLGESGADLALLAEIVGNKNWTDLQTELQGADINCPEGTTSITGASILTLDDGVHLWVKFE